MVASICFLSHASFPEPNSTFFSENVQFGQPGFSENVNIFRMLRTGTRFLKKRRNFEDAPHGSAILFKIFRMLRAGARFLMTKRRNFEDAPPGAQFSSKLSGRSARKRNFGQKDNEMLMLLRTEAQFHSKFKDAPHRSAIFDEETMKF